MKLRFYFSFNVPTDGYPIYFYKYSGALTLDYFFELISIYLHQKLLISQDSQRILKFIDCLSIIL